MLTKFGKMCLQTKFGDNRMSWGFWRVKYTIFVTLFLPEPTWSLEVTPSTNFHAKWLKRRDFTYIQMCLLQ